ncbi:MAG: PAS domain S-box protein [Desulfobacteraceae bacterium]|nr:PAS domain S-box protein [Desulfobacteraceae bacterium]
MEKVNLKLCIMNLFKNPLLRYILIITIGVLVIFPIFCVSFIFPQFVKQLTVSNEDSALRAATHLKNSILKETTQLTKQSISKNLIRKCLSVKEDLNLEKIKIFMDSGEILFSTDPTDIGKFNTHDYFHNHITRGNVLIKTVKKGTTTLENRIVNVEVIETYIPLIHDGIFIGAVEVYYDITQRKAALTKLLIHLKQTILLFAAIIMIVVLSIIFKASQNIIEKELAATSLKNAHAQSEKKVIERTTELKKSNQSLKIKIEEQQHADQALQESEQRYRSLVETSVEAIISINEKMEIIQWNQAASTIFGYFEEETIKKSISLLSSDLYSRILPKKIDILLRTGIPETKSSTIEFEARTKNLDKIPVELSLSAFKKSKNWIITLIIRDISQRKKAELELTHSYETQSIVNILLTESLGDASITVLLERCLTLLLSLPWFAFESKGCIFLVEETPDILIMKVSHGLSDELKTRCSKLPFGECLCGRAALSKKLEFSNHVDEHHTYQFKEMTDHGHYCIPIIAKHKVFGVINIYVKKGHKQNKFEEGFLTAIANTMAGILIQRYGEEEKKKIEEQLRQSQKLESIGQLAAGIAHEINTPIQYIGDNTNFLENAFQDLDTIIKDYDLLLTAAKNGPIDKTTINQIEATIEETDLDFLEQEIPSAIKQSLEGIDRVSKIVTSMKEFSHPGGEEKIFTDINHALYNTLTVANNEWKYVATLTTNFDDSLPLVLCNPGELNQVFLNIIINASHSIADSLRDQPDKKGSILISTLKKGKWAQIKISDTGMGIPQKIQNKYPPS